MDTGNFEKVYVKSELYQEILQRNCASGFEWENWDPQLVELKW